MRSIAGYAFLGLYTLVLGPPVLLLSALFSNERLIIEAGFRGTAIALRLAGIRYRLIGAERMPATGAVYCLNHTSFMDLVSYMALYPHCRSLRVLYKAEFNKVPLLGRIFRMAGCIPIVRQQQELAFQAVDRSVEALQRGVSVLAAPEGTRSRDGSLAPFKKGVFVMAIRAQVPVVPVAIRDARRALPKGAWQIRPCEITVTVGDRVSTKGLSYDDRQQLADRVRTGIAAMLSIPEEL